MPKFKVGFTQTRYIEFEIGSEDYTNNVSSALDLVEFVNNLREDPMNYYMQEKEMQEEGKPKITIDYIEEIED